MYRQISVSRNKATTVCIIVAVLCTSLFSQTDEKIAALLDRYRGTGFTTSDSATFAYNITTWQMSHGGFSKARDYSAPWNGTAALSDWSSGSTPLGMFDNNATVAEARFVSNVYKKTTDTTRKALLKQCVVNIMGFVLKSQYASGGWPQVYPERTGTVYSNYVTFNDNAMIRIMVMIRDIVDKKAPFDSDIIDAATLTKLQTALDKGVDFCLKSQIVNNSKPTVWCAQHDPVNFTPLGARSYELPSKSGAESVGVVAFLMNWANQTSQIQNAVNGAIDWYKKNKVTDLKFEKGQFVPAAGASMWYRFYNVENDSQFFCGRDGIKKYNIMEIEEERRTGYSWGGDYGSGLLTAAAFYQPAKITTTRSASTTIHPVSITKDLLIVSAPCYSSINITIINGLGKTVIAQQSIALQQSTQFSLGKLKLPKGIYFASVKINGKHASIESLIIQ